ncbi:hypothetical protein EJ08DRAFT_699726 [Tothia fuscella]|uniref:Uncharacterized protein n=1 Tax=Tothia fuscella TaxID=1048955 RepID=A0A9P4NML0_9PEZI|nr:hypothetical protein EJ08DRAFT_699726 [Tothia fuscella]
MPSITSIATVLGLFMSVLAKTDLSGCTSSKLVVNGGASLLYYVPSNGEICAPLDCGGGRAPPKSTVPGCAAYVGTETYSPSFLPNFGAATPTATATATAIPSSPKQISLERWSSVTANPSPLYSTWTGSYTTTPSAVIVSTESAAVISSVPAAVSSGILFYNGTVSLSSTPSPSASSTSSSLPQSNHGVASRLGSQVVLAGVALVGLVLA